MPEGMLEQAFILAAGKGERLWPYGDTLPKAALPIANIPLIHYQLDALHEVGIKEVYVATNHLEGNVRNAVALWKESNPSQMGVTCLRVDASRGNVQSLLGILNQVNLTQKEIICIYGDTLFTRDALKKLVREHHQETTSILVTPLTGEESKDCFRAEVNNQSIVEIKGHSRGQTQSSRRLQGVGVFPINFLHSLPATPEIPTCVEIGAMPPKEQMLEETCLQWVRSGHTIHAVEGEGILMDIDKPWDFLEANRLMSGYLCSQLAGNIQIMGEGSSIHPSARIEGNVRLGTNSTIGPGVIIYGNLIVGDNTIITDGAMIEPNVIIGNDCKIWRGCLIGTGSVIGHRCVVGHGAEVEGLMMDESYSYHYGEFYGILGRCCDLGAATVCGTLRFDDGDTVHRVRGRKETPRYHANASYLGDFVRTGVNAILMPGIKVGAYSLIGAGVVLNEDVPNNTSVFVEQTHTRGKWGPERYGW